MSPDPPLKLVVDRPDLQDHGLEHPKRLLQLGELPVLVLWWYFEGTATRPNIFSLGGEEHKEDPGIAEISGGKVRSSFRPLVSSKPHCQTHRPLVPQLRLDGPLLQQAS